MIEDFKDYFNGVPMKGPRLLEKNKNKKNKSSTMCFKVYGLTDVLPYTQVQILPLQAYF